MQLYQNQSTSCPAQVLHSGQSPRLELELSHVGTFKGSQQWSSTTRASKQDVTGFFPLHSQSHWKGSNPSTAGMGDGIWAGLMHAISQRYLQSSLTRWLAPPRNLSWNLLHKEKLIIFWSACPPLLQMLALSQLKDWHLKWGNWQVILVRPHWHLFGRKQLPYRKGLSLRMSIWASGIGRQAAFIIKDQKWAHGECKNVSIWCICVCV